MISAGGGFPAKELLVSTEWLAEHLDEPGLRILDVRPAMPQLRIGFQWGHIPGAIPLALESLFTGRATGVPGSLGLPDERQEVLRQAGLQENEPVVVYDSDAGPAAAQAFWLLEYLGFRQVRVLDGGFFGWQNAGLPVRSEEPAWEPSDCRTTEQPLTLATLEGLLREYRDPGQVVVDTRTAAEYAAGRIPGAVWWPWDDSMEPGLIPSFKSADVLAASLAAKGITPDKQVTVYCQTGARSAHLYLILRLLGYPRVRNYDGSWLEWETAPDTPKEI